MNREKYNRNDPKGWCGDITRGAALGRPSLHADEPSAFDGKLRVNRVRLNRGGYDPNGTYFGVGAPLWWCHSEDGDVVDFMLRAEDHASAKAAVRKKYPNAKVR